MNADDAGIAELERAMQAWGVLETPAPDAALRWIAVFLEAYGERLERVDDARPLVAGLRAEACMIPALELERLRSRDVLFYLDSVSQYVDAQPELRGLPLATDLPIIGQEFGLRASDAVDSVRMAITGEKAGPPLELLFPLLGHRRGELEAAARARARTDRARARRQALRADPRRETVVSVERLSGYRHA